MEITTLQYYLEIVRQENITRAAEVLHVTQPALTRQMQRLEEELGVRLFDRGKTIRLTDAGKILRERAEEIVRLSEKTKADLRSSEEVSGRISIGSGILSSNIILSEIMEAFYRRHPHVQFELYVNSAEYVKDRLDRSQLDFALMLQPVDVTRYAYIELRETERIGLLLRADHPLARKGWADRADLGTLPLILPARQGVQSFLEHELGVSLSELNVFAVNNLCSNSILFARHGIAAILTMEGAVVDYLHGELAFIPLHPQHLSSSVFVWNKHLTPFGAPGKFLEFFQSRLEQYRSGLI
jgi:DNA-binding transcriptional LysR family regulator